MKIEFHNVPVSPFECETAIFKLGGREGGGGEVAINRCVTESLRKNEDGTYDMIWRKVYLLAVNGHRLFSKPAFLSGISAANLLKETKSISFEVTNDKDYDFSKVTYKI